MRYLVSLVLLALMFSAGPAAAVQRKYTPRPGSAERGQIVYALRSVVQKDLIRPVVFKIDVLNVQDGWAFLQGVPLDPSGKPFDYRGTRYQTSIAAGTFDDWICALLIKDGTRWRVVESVIGATDAPFVDWANRHRAPAGIFK